MTKIDDRRTARAFATALQALERRQDRVLAEQRHVCAMCDGSGRVVVFVPPLSEEVQKCPRCVGEGLAQW